MIYYNHSRALSSAAEHYVHIVGVTGSNPVVSTISGIGNQMVFAYKGFNGSIL